MWAGQVIAAVAFSLGALMYHVVSYRSRLIPPWLSVWGLIAAVVWLAAALLALFGQIDSLSTTRALLDVPAFANEMVLAAFLILKGFSPTPMASEAAWVGGRTP